MSDRKSTRLNSSHLGISYAVFCLKKKKRAKHTRISSPPTSPNRACRPSDTHVGQGCPSGQARAPTAPTLLCLFFFFFFFLRTGPPPNSSPLPPPPPPPA